MNAIAFPSGDQRGTAICNPCSGPLDLSRRQNRLRLAAQVLRVKLRHPPVVFARRIGGNIGQALRIRRPVELVHMQIRRRHLFGELLRSQSTGTIATR